MPDKCRVTVNDTVNSECDSVSGAQGHKEKPSEFRIRRGSVRKMTRAELEERHGYRKGAPEEAKKEYWVWGLEG